PSTHTPLFPYTTLFRSELAADAHPARAAADHGLAALLGHRDACGRIPLRPGLDPRARAARGGPALGLLRHHPAGPGDLPGQADRDRKSTRLNSSHVSIS